MRWREFRHVVAILCKHDANFRIETTKSSHRMVVHPDVDGVMRHYPLPYHGAKTPVAPGMQKDLIRIFQLPPTIFD